MVEKIADKIVLELYENIKQANPGINFSKLNLLHLDYSYRVRYEKDESGKVVAKIMDRGFIGLLGSKIGLASLDSDSVYTCFIYGKKTIGFVLVDNKILANKNLQDSADFQVLLANFCREKNIVNINWVDTLPTGKIERKSSQKTLADCLENIKTIDELGSELGF